MERATAGLAMGGALTGEAASRTFAAGARLETAGLSGCAATSTTKRGRLRSTTESTLGSSKPTKAETAIAYTPEPPLPPGGLPCPLATPGAWATPGAPGYAADAAGAPIAGPGALAG